MWERSLSGAENYELTGDPFSLDAGGAGPNDKRRRFNMDLLQKRDLRHPLLRIEHLSKSFGAHEVLRDIDFTVYRGDVISVIGSSGSGKSTLLRCVNLLETPSSGEIRFHSSNILSPGINVPGYRAKVGMVFQSFNLFDNMSVLKNCEIGQRKVLSPGRRGGPGKSHALSAQGGHGAPT